MSLGSERADYKEALEKIASSDDGSWISAIDKESCCRWCYHRTRKDGHHLECPLYIAQQVLDKYK